jgi:trigger factor
MKVAVEQIEGCKRRLAVEAPADMVQQEWERAWGRVQRSARLPGFRKGHVPRSLVRLHFAADVRREVANHLIPNVYRQAVSEARLDPVNEPDLQDVRLEEGAPLSFVAVVEVKPTIELGDVKGLEVRHAPPPLTDAEVDAALGELREQYAEFRSVDRAAKEGDLVVVDYTLRPEDHEPTTATGYHFVIGAGTVIPEIDRAAAGMHAGDAREVTIRFADDHRMETLRGRAGTASLEVSEVKEKIVPPLDDEFAKSTGEYDTLDGLRRAVRARLEERRRVEEARQLEDKLVDALLARHAFNVPETMVMRQVAHQVEHARERLRRQGVDPDRVPWDYAKIVTELKPAAERAVRRTLLLEAIADREAIQAAEADVDAEVEKVAQAAQRPPEQVRRMMEQSGDLEGLRHGLRERRTLDFLIEHATVRG